MGAISAEAEVRARALESRRSELERACADVDLPPSLQAALGGPAVSVLAEVKRSSPSKGAIAALDPVVQARAYETAGAAAVSVLTEPRHFGGSNEDLLAIRRELQIPALKKDFHVAPVQLLEARALGASAALLIAKALAPDRLTEMMRTAKELGLEVLVEVRDLDELERALSEGATMIGVNNRDLETLIMDPTTADRVIPRIPTHVIAIAESGIQFRADVERYALAGADAVLVGSALSAAEDPVTATRALVGVPRKLRVR